MSHGPIVGHFGPPMVNRPSPIGSAKDKNRKITVQDTTIESARVPAMVRGQPDKQRRQHSRRPDRCHRGAVFRADRRQHLRRAKDAAIAREGEQHAAGRSDRGQTAQPLRCQNRDVKQRLDRRVHSRIHAPEEHVPTLPGGVFHIRQHQHERTQHDPAQQARPADRRHHALAPETVAFTVSSAVWAEVS